MTLHGVATKDQEKRMEKMTKQMIGVIFLAGLLSFCGCDSGQQDFTPLPTVNSDKADSSDKATPSSAVAKSEVPVANPATPAEKKQPEISILPTQQPTTEKPKTVVKDAEAGLGKQAQNYKKHEFLGELARSFFRSRERINYMTVQKNIDLYHATYERYPKTLEEFQKEILDPSGIKLPELKEGCRYFYDPETGKLMIEEPIKVKE